uniref:Glycine rich superfamily member n=1 Tax=Rhipicephalus zambeziensis TaxID=60191 RepID=A0A224YE31_9ACAR
MVLLVTVTAFLAAVATATGSYGPQRRMAGRRMRRTVDALCGNEKFVNAALRTLMDELRPALTATEPLVLGDGPECGLGGVRLLRGRLWGAASVHLREPVLLRCDAQHMIVLVHVALNNSEIAFDWEASPKILLGSEGTVSVFTRHMSLKTSVRLPRSRAIHAAAASPTRVEARGGAASPIRVVTVRVTKLIGADVTVSGPWPYGLLMSAAANLFLKSFPVQVRALVSDPLRNGFQHYLDENFA